jgi:NhaP-type Na+/H+ or K+/H+ antiporter
MCPVSFSIVGLLVPSLMQPSYPFVTRDVLAAIRGASHVALVFGLVMGVIAGWLLHWCFRRISAWSLVRHERRYALLAEKRRLLAGLERRRLAALDGRYAH